MREAIRLSTLLVLVVPVGLASATGGCEKSPSSTNAEAVPLPGLPADPAAPDAPSTSGTSTSSGDPSPQPDPRPSGPPVEKRPPNGVNQHPAFPGQTRAPSHPTNVAFDVRIDASGLVNPWAVAFLPDGAKLVTERPGRMRIIGADGTLSEPLGGLPNVDARGQGGLLDVTLDPAFAQNDLVYFSYSEPREGGNGTAVARGRLVRTGAPRLENVQVIWRQMPTMDSTNHFGSRLVFAPNGNLFITLGERASGTSPQKSQELGTALGKVVRIRPDGTIPQDNPFAGTQGALPEVWSFGHRNVQGAAIHPQTGELWVIDHGARGGDEVNIARPGKNYGWPTITYGIDYGGGPIGEGLTAQAGMEQPLYYWDPSIAPCGAAFYDGELFPAWKGSLFVGALAGKHLVRLTLEGEHVIGEERLLEDKGRIRDIRVGPGGTIFVSDESNGHVVELVPSLPGIRR